MVIFLVGKKRKKAGKFPAFFVSYLFVFGKYFGK